MEHNTLSYRSRTSSRNHARFRKRQKKRKEDQCHQNRSEAANRCADMATSENNEYYNRGKSDGFYKEWVCEEQIECVCDKQYHIIKAVYGYTRTDGGALFHYMDNERMGWCMM